MNSETKTCQNCKQDFTIEPDDFTFYEKIKVPPPTWCPECRLVRRLSFMNERTFYWRNCDLCKKKMLSIYDPSYTSPVFCQECWWSDKWDPTTHGEEVDFSRPFLGQFLKLTRKVPALSLNNISSTLENSDFVNLCSYLRNCYLMFHSDYDDNCAYSTYLEKSKDCLDIYIGHLCESSYFGNNLYQDYKVFFSSYCDECTNVWFSKNLKGCSDCFGCINLRNKKYCIFNQQYSKEEYRSKFGEFRTGSHEFVERMKGQMRNFYTSYPQKFMEGLQNVNCSGDSIFNSRNVRDSYEVSGGEYCRHCQLLFVEEDDNAYEAYDFTLWGSHATRMYECMGCGNKQSDIKFCYGCWSNSARMQYSWYILTNCEDIFGCVGLKNKQFCILNKQYTRSEYFALFPKVVKHMKEMLYSDAHGKKYSYGEFFPVAFSTSAYNDSMAQKHFPKDMSEALASGFAWTERDLKIHSSTVVAANLADDIRDTDDSILDATIECEHQGTCKEQCTAGFRLTKSELDFYRTMNLPLPRKCHNCRHYEILSRKNPIRFYERKCMCEGTKSSEYKNQSVHFHDEDRCPNTFETSYAPDRPEIVYCEQCYNAEVV